MPLDVPRRSFLLAEDQDADELLRVLGEGLAAGRSLRLDTAPAVAQTSTILDTVDRRLRRAGLQLVAQPGGRSTGNRNGNRAGDGVVLVLEGGGRTRPLRAELSRGRQRYLLGDLPAGPLRTRLARVIEMRALLPIVDLQRRDHAAAVLNIDDKTVVRVLCSDLSAAAPEGPAEPVALGGRVEVAGILGYPRPFARVDTALRRDLGLAEPTTSVVDDAVVALGGDPAGLSNQVKVALKPDEPAGPAARRILVRLSDMVEANVPGTLADLDTEFLHDLRVAIRRSRSVVRELKRVFADEPRREHAATLRWIQGITGPLRDLDVQLLDWDELVAQLPDERREFLGPALVVLRKRRAAELTKLRRMLRAAQFRRRWDAWRSFLAAETAATVGPRADRALHEVASRRVHKVFDRMVRDGSAIAADSPGQALHDLRKKGKELRYLLESFGALWPRSVVKPLVTDLKALQDVLGRHQDCEVQSTQLRELAGDLVGVAGGSDAVLALGSLVERLANDQQRARADFAERFAAFSEHDLERIM